MNYFFSPEELNGSNAVLNQSKNCDSCKLFKGCITPKIEPMGKGKKGILIVGKAPTKSDDEQGKHFSGDSGQLLRKHLRNLDIDLERDCITTTTVRCRTGGKELKSQEINGCRQHILDLINDFKPKMILLLGDEAVESLIGYRWKKDLDNINKWRGWTIPDRDFNAWVCPMFNPGELIKSTSDVSNLIFQQDLERALNKLNDPVPSVKKEEDRVEILSPDEAVRYIRDVIKRKPLTSLDYETTGLKPHAKGHDIFSTAISEGYYGKSFLMNDERVRQAMRFYIRNRLCKKIIANAPFEMSWSAVILDAILEGLVMDVTQSAHVLDNRPGITSVKFQAFVLLGRIDYSSHIEQWLKADSKDGNGVNKIRLAPVRDILLYGGVDGIVEYDIAKKHAKELMYG